jgi:DUF1009 family protein
MGEPLGIVAGGGSLPADVARAALAAGRPVFVLALQGFADLALLAPFPHAVIRLGAIGRGIALMRQHHCRDVVMIGGVKRPSMTALRPDITALGMIARGGKAMLQGDDSLLGALFAQLTQMGFRMLGAHEVVGGLLAPSGLLAGAAPDAAAEADIARGVAVVRLLGAADVGQGCVVQAGLVLAVEAIEGTDAMLARAGSLRQPGAGGVLVKLIKPAQDRRADLPTIGPATVAAAAAAGLRGIVFSAGGALIAERDATIAAARARGLFLLGLSPEETDRYEQLSAHDD